jgi:hypothetical protein
MNLKNVLKQLWKCDRGFVVSNELVLMTTIIVFGMIVGLATVRDQVVQEFGDVSVGIGALNQSYSFAGVPDLDPNNPPAYPPVGSSPGSSFDDKSDFCDVFGFDIPNSEPACINITEAAHPPVF